MSSMEEIITLFSTFEEVDAIALGGSRVTKKYDRRSDYDIYLYLNKELPIEKREAVLKEQCKRLELGNHYWELEDNGTLLDGTDFDFVYRTIQELDQDLTRVLVECKPSNSYTTCFWYNLLTCKVLYEKESVLTRLKKKYEIPYPNKLKKAIVHNHLNLLHGALPAFDKQIEKAMLRQDLVSVNHRVTEFTATYFDLLFAVNELPHPGEKRMLSYAKENCDLLPYQFEKNWHKLYHCMFTMEALVVIHHLVDEIEKKCKDQELI